MFTFLLNVFPCRNAPLRVRVLVNELTAKIKIKINYTEKSLLLII